MIRGVRASEEADEILMKMLFGSSKKIGPWGFFWKIVSLADMVLKSLLFWFYISFIFNSSNPLLTVISDSMYPSFKKGDYIMTTSISKAISGNIVNYRVNSSYMYIVHRVIETQTNETDFLVMTKGDANNFTDDSISNLSFLNDKMIKEDVIGVIPWIGYINLIIKRSPALFALFIWFTSLSSMR